jgi:RNA polymerase sigma-70 factor (family 1)
MRIYHKLSDQELIELLKAEDNTAFEEIFLRYEPLLLNFVYKKIKDRDEAKDILQDIFIQVWNNRNRMVIVSLSSYLYTMALNKIRDRYKHQVIHEEHIAKLQVLIDQKDRGADYQIREKDITLLIEKEIAALPLKMREVFQLRKDAFLSNREISEKLGISEQTVETHMKRALKTLKQRLGPAVYLIYVVY